MLTFNRFKVMIKRSLKQKINIAMLILLVILLIIYKNIPEKEKSEYIPVAILNNDSSEDSKKMIDDLLNHNSIFTFYEVTSREEIFNDIASKKADLAFEIPEDFMDSCTHISEINKITLYLTEGPELHSLAREEVFSAFFKYAALRILKDRIAGYEELDNIDTSELNKMTEEIYYKYLNSGEIFSVEDMSGGSYNALTKVEGNAIPIRKLCAFFIFAAGLMGVLSYLYDKENGIYLRLNKKENIILRFIHIIATLLPVSTLSYLVLILSYPKESFIKQLYSILIYVLATAVISFIFSLLIRKSSLFQKLLPLILVATIIFGGIFFDMSKYNETLNIISRFFITSYF